MNDRYVIAPVVGTFDVLEFVLASTNPLSAAEISRGCGRDKTTTYRYVRTLLFLGYLQVTERGRYEIGPAIYALQTDDARDRTIRAIAEPVIRDLNATLHETVNLGVPKGRRVYYLAIVAGAADGGGIAQVGDGDYFHCTALGKAILAFQNPEIRAAHLRAELLRLTDHTILDKRRLFAELSEVRRRGYAVDRDENEAGYSCFGVPVRDGRGLPVAAISVSLRSARVTRAREFEVSESVIAAARRIEAKLARRHDGMLGRSERAGRLPAGVQAQTTGP